MHWTCIGKETNTDVLNYKTLPKTYYILEFLEQKLLHILIWLLIVSHTNSYFINIFHKLIPMYLQFMAIFKMFPFSYILVFAMIFRQIGITFWNNDLCVMQSIAKLIYAIVFAQKIPRYTTFLAFSLLLFILRNSLKYWSYYDIAI